MVGAAAAGQTTRRSSTEGVEVGLFVQSTIWDPRSAHSFPLLLHCSCRTDSQYSGRELNVIDGVEGEGESDCLLVPPSTGTDPYQLNVPNPGHPGDYWIWCYQFEDAAGHPLSRLGEPKEDLGSGEILYPYPEHAPQRILTSDGGFFLSSLNSAGVSTVEAARIILRAFVVLDFKVVGRSNVVVVNIVR